MKQPLQQFLHSGIIELWVLVLATRRDEQKFCEMKSIHPGVQQAVRLFEKNMEQRIAA